MAGRCLAGLSCCCFVPGVILFVHFRERQQSGEALDPSKDFKLIEGQCEIVDSGWQEETQHTIQTLTFEDAGYDNSCNLLKDDECNQVDWYACIDTYIYGFRAGKNSDNPSTVVFNSRPVTLQRTKKGRDEAKHACHGTDYAIGRFAKGPVVKDKIADCWQPSRQQGRDFSQEQRKAYDCANAPCFKLSDPVEEFAEYKDLNNVLFVMSAACIGGGILMLFAAWVEFRRKRRKGGNGGTSQEESDEEGAEDLLGSKKSRKRNYEEESSE